jgi:DNA excision repair protein ERCC-4
VRIGIDVHERASGLPELLVALGAAVEVRSLPVGDYLLGRGVVVERKTVLDLHTSLLQGRFWRQLGKLRGRSRWPYLLVEGGDLDSGPLSAASARGACLAAMEQRIRLIRAFDHQESAEWLFRLAVRSQRPRRKIDRPAYAQQPSAPTGDGAAEALLAAIPGISTASARALLAHFGSVADVINARPEQLRLVEGIGEQRAASLRRTVSARWRSQRAPGPST